MKTLAEFTALLDELYKNNKINKLLYKTLYYKVNIYKIKTF